ncbi:MAG: response regulator transcription factor [Bacteroidota bacterium]
MKLYIADDQTLFRKGMVKLLKSFRSIETIKEADNGKEMIELVKKDPPDVILMDLEMPIMSGIDASQHILNRYPDVKIIVLSMHKSERVVFEMIQMGVHSYLVKNADPEEVKKAIDAVLANDFYYNDLMADVMRKASMGKISNDNPLEQKGGTLTEREIEILKMICCEMTMKEISHRLSLSEKTIHNHRSNMMEKTGARNTVGLVRYAFENKLVYIET